MITAVMNAMIEYFRGDVRRINHALKVHAFSRLIARASGIGEAQCTIVALAALLHDIGIREAERKYQSTSGTHQEVEGPPIARRILDAYDIDPAIVDRVCFIIGHHHSYARIDAIDLQIVIEADFLVNIFEDSLQRTAIENIRNTIFRTETGTSLLEGMYLRNDA